MKSAIVQIWEDNIKCVAHRQGEEGDNFYVIGEGTFEARILQPDGEEKTVFTYEGKGAFGELALMYNCPRAATVLVQEALINACNSTSFQAPYLCSVPRQD